jgi:hypothetical protein
LPAIPAVESFYLDGKTLVLRVEQFHKKYFLPIRHITTQAICGQNIQQGWSETFFRCETLAFSVNHLHGFRGCSKKI